jgi:hypothetical protein
MGLQVTRSNACNLKATFKIHACKQSVTTMPFSASAMSFNYNQEPPQRDKNMLDKAAKQSGV